MKAAIIAIAALVIVSSIALNARDGYRVIANSQISAGQADAS